MMLRTLLPSLSRRYAFAGSAIGALVPLIGFSAELLLSGGDVVLERIGEPVHALIATVPLLTGMIAYQYGQSVDLLCRRLKARERAERQLISLSLHDRLTGLPNRLALEKEIDRFIGMRREDFRPALLLLDLNKFKYVNELLRQFTDRLKQTLGPLVRLFRLGGDEFVVTLSGRPEDCDVERLCRVIEALASEPFLLAAGQAVTGISIGIAFLAPEDHGMGEILKRADLALYLAKDLPGSAHAFHTEGLGRFMQEQTALEVEIGRAIDSGDFFLEYQPIVNANRTGLQAFEALVRWRHAERGVVLPASFLPIAARAGHIARLGRWIVAKAIADAASWPETIGLAINVSAEELRDPGYVAHIADCLATAGMKPSRLTVDVTEDALVADRANLGVGLAHLRSLGVRIALDDFGIGQSSINLLRQCPVDLLKVDRSFTQAMAESGQDCAIVDLIVKLGRAFNVPTTVEGVENERQMHMALSMGAAAVQGYLISQPVSAGEVAQMLIAANLPGQADPEIRFIA